VNKVVPPEQLRDTATAWAEEIMRNGLAAVGLAKRAVDMSFTLSSSEGLELAGIIQSLLISGGGSREEGKPKGARG